MTDKMENAFANGRGWYSTITELVHKLRVAQEDQDTDTLEAVEQEIQEGPLSVLVRDGGRAPYAGGASGNEDGPEEYEILLSTGGPALRIYGKIGQYRQPKSAELQAQDWFTPWVRVPDCNEETLRTYAACFYFGEG